MKYKLVCFDVDGTLVDNIVSAWKLFHDAFGVNPDLREKAMQSFYNKEISYEQWAQHDIELWQKEGIQRKDFVAALESSNVKLMSGTEETLSVLDKRGIKLAIISGSLCLILDYVFADYRSVFSDVFISTLHFDEKGYISSVDATEYDMKGKAIALQQIAKKEGVGLSECVFVGDHHNDVDAAKEAGLSIAFNATDEQLRKIADIVIDKKDLREILPYILPEYSS